MKNASFSISNILAKIYFAFSIDVEIVQELNVEYLSRTSLMQDRPYYENSSRVVLIPCHQLQIFVLYSCHYFWNM